MKVAEQFAQLLASGKLASAPNITHGQFEPVLDRVAGRTRTVYSIGEAIRRKEQGDNAKLGTSTR